MADLSKIISENVETALERAAIKARETGGKLNWSELARRMSRHMPAPKDPREARDPDTIARRMRDFRTGVSEWRADYLEAVATVLGTHPSRLTSDDYSNAKVPEATVAGFLTNALGRRLEPAQARRIVANLNRELDRPGMFELCDAVVRAILDAKDHGNAVGAVLTVVQAGRKLWESEVESETRPVPREPRRKNP